MKTDDEKAVVSAETEKAERANEIANIQHDNGPRPFDKIEGSMNNGETGGFGKKDTHTAMDETPAG